MRMFGVTNIDFRKGFIQPVQKEKWAEKEGENE